MLDRIRSLLREAAHGSFDDPHRPDSLQVAVAGLLVEVARMHDDFDPAERGRLYATACERWADYTGSRRFRAERLTFVQNRPGNVWVDVDEYELGAVLA